MLTGHFGVSYALKAKEKHASLGLLFLAVGFADLLWSLFILFGREHAQLAPNLPSSRINLYYMPFDHSLVGILFWSIVIYVLFRFLPVPQGARKSSIAMVMAVAVFSPDAEELAKICTRVLVLRDGRIVRELTGAELTEEAVVESSITEKETRLP